MQTLKIDSNNQLIIEQGGLSVIEGIEAAAQDTRTRIGLYKAEDPFNIEKGIDFDYEILGKMGGIDYIRDLISERIADNADINGVSSVNVEHNGGRLNITADVETIFGRTSL